MTNGKSRTESPTPGVLLVGPADAGGFSDLLQRLGTWSSTGEIQLERIRGSQLVDRLAGAPPDLVVVCQSWPDEFAAASVERVLCAWPLARVLCCYGPWCASDGRTRSQWPLAVRVPVDQAAARLAAEWDVLTGRKAPMPLTAARDEAFAGDYLAGLDCVFDSGLADSAEIVVLTPDRSYGEILNAACLAAGLRVLNVEVAVASGSLPRLLVWDTALSGEPGDDPRHLTSQFHATAVVAIVDASRPETDAALRAAGVDAVHPRLASLGQLFSTLRRLLPEGVPTGATS